MLCDPARIERTFNPGTGALTGVIVERFVYDGVAGVERGELPGRADVILDLRGTGLTLEEAEANLAVKTRYLWAEHARAGETSLLLAQEDVAALATTPTVANVLWAFSDHQGTVRDLARLKDTAGVLTIQKAAHYSFDAFGRFTGGQELNAAGTALVAVTGPSVFGANSTRYLYTSQEFDRYLRTYHYNRRVYDPGSGVFTITDPIGFAAGDTNLSRYVGNGPVNYTDPNGLENVSGFYVWVYTGRWETDSSVYNAATEAAGVSYTQNALSAHEDLRLIAATNTRISPLAAVVDVGLTGLEGEELSNQIERGNRPQAAGLGAQNNGQIQAPLAQNPGQHGIVDNIQQFNNQHKLIPAPVLQKALNQKPVPPPLNPNQPRNKNFECEKFLAAGVALGGVFLNIDNGGGTGDPDGGEQPQLPDEASGNSSLDKTPSLNDESEIPANRTKLGRFLEGDDVAEAADHAKEVGKVTGVVDRAGTDARRAERIKGCPIVPGKDRDEFPPAVIKPDDPSKVSIKPIDPCHNRRSGRRLRDELPPDGTSVEIEP